MNLKGIAAGELEMPSCTLRVILNGVRDRATNG